MEAQIAQFHQDGYVVVRGLFTDASPWKIEASVELD